MLRKFFKVDIMTRDNQRITIHMEADDVRDIVPKLAGHRLTFIPRTKENYHTFTLYTHTLSRIEYEVVTDTGFGKFLIYDVFAD